MFLFSLRVILQEPDWVSTEFLQNFQAAQNLGDSLV